jgi:hypothetical protein
MTASLFPDDWDDPDLWSEPGFTADLVAYLASGALDAFSGRYIHAANDRWRQMAAGSAMAIADDLYALRVRAG